MSRVPIALDLFRSQYNCSQAVLTAFGPDCGLERGQCLAAASGFGAGIGRLGETCGAVTGAIMVLGLQYGRGTVDDPTVKAAVYERVRELVAHFRQRNGSVICRELLGCDISTAEGFQSAKDRNLHETLCVKLVRDAVEILDEMLK